MIGITRLWCGARAEGDALRYGETGPSDGGFTAPATVRERRPIVVWNATRRCNLHCVHCYSDSHDRSYDDEMTTGQARLLIDQLAAYRAPVLLFSGGEPLTRPDVLMLASLARERGLRTVISTNGTLIDEQVAEHIRKAGVSYVGISLDGIGDVNDRFRGVKGAFELALRGFRACRGAGQKVGLRLTLTAHNVAELPRIFDFIEEERIPRACFYHLVPAGRARGLNGGVLPHDTARQAITYVMDRSRALHAAGRPVEVLTVDNHCDGVFLYQRLLREDSARAADALRLLEWNGGAAGSTGVGIACVGWSGDVYPDQFWRHVTLGNVRDRSFGQIWDDTSHPLMAGLKDRLPLLKGKCGRCTFKAACGGSLRVRADLVHGDPWAEDPACYLSEAEIAAHAPTTTGPGA